MLFVSYPCILKNDFFKSSISAIVVIYSSAWSCEIFFVLCLLWELVTRLGLFDVDLKLLDCYDTLSSK